MGRQRPFVTPMAVDALRVLGQQIRMVRHERRWTVTELAERVQVSAATIRAIENGSPSVSVGIVLTTMVQAGIPLFDADAAELAKLERRGRDRLGLLPSRVDPPRKGNASDFDF